MKKAMPILAIGGLWGLLEATLGTLLHLSFFEPAGLWMGSSVIMIPIAYFLLGMLWKATSDAKSILYAGFIAAGIKLTLLAFVFIPGSGIMLRAVINPALSIVLEAALLMVGVIIFKPKSLLSLQAGAVVLFANTTWRLGFVLWQLATFTVFGSKFWALSDAGSLVFNLDPTINFALTLNGISCLYVLGIGAIAFGISKLLQIKKVTLKIDGLKRFFAHPAVAATLVVIAIAATILLEL